MPDLDHICVILAFDGLKPRVFRNLDRDRGAVGDD